MNVIDLPNSCSLGVCRIRASMLVDGLMDQQDAIGVNEYLRGNVFPLLCVPYPKLDLRILIGDDVEDNLYNDQFGKYQK